MQKGEADVAKNAPADILPTHFLSHCSLTQQEDQLAFFCFFWGGHHGQRNAVVNVFNIGRIYNKLSCLLSLPNFEMQILAPVVIRFGRTCVISTPR